jgi:hypothetical protein
MIDVEVALDEVGQPGRVLPVDKRPQDEAGRGSEPKKVAGNGIQHEPLSIKTKSRRSIATVVPRFAAVTHHTPQFEV